MTETASSAPAIEIPADDRRVLRELGEQKAAIAALPIQNQRRQMWSAMNQMESVKPLVWFDDICWNEMNVNDELTLRTQHQLARRIETQLRQELYRWRRIQGDTVIEPVIHSLPSFRDTGFGLRIEADLVEAALKGGLPSAHFKPQIRGEDDIEKIKMPEVSVDRAKTEENYQLLRDVFDGVIDVVHSGVPGFWFAPWDEIVMWTGVQEALEDLAARPDYMHKLIDRLMTAHLCRLDQYERLNLLAPNSSNVRVGSGAYGYSTELPGTGFDPEHVRTTDLWGCSTAQIFVAVSPKMHWEFAIEYEIRWLERFGLNYYGCCEPLHGKMDYVKRIPNLRKISMSPWADVAKARENGADDYVLSIKPNPEILARDRWSLDLAREQLSDMLDQARGCAVEVVMKDISTVRGQPQRLWEWVEMARALTEEYAYPKYQK